MMNVQMSYSPPKFSITYRIPSFISGNPTACWSRGGRLILTTHGIFVYHPDPQDNWRSTSEGLRRLVEKHGYQVVEMRGLVGGGRQPRCKCFRT